MSVSDSTVKKSNPLLKATGAFSSMTFISRILGFIRDIVIATTFGATPAMDAFLIAFKIPNFMRRLFAEGAFSQAFVPVLAQYQTTQDPQKTQSFINKVTGTLGAVLLLITVIAVLSTPVLVMIFAPGFEPGGERYTLASTLLRITFPYLFLISLTAMAAAVLNTYGRFAMPALTPVILNIAMILGAWCFANYFTQPIEALAWSVLIAGILQLLFQLPFLKHLSLLPKPQFAWRDSGVQKVLKLMVPALFGVSVAQLNLLVDTIFASTLSAGSVSWLYYSDRLMNFPLGVFGVAIATVILPHLSRQLADNNTQAYAQSLDWGLRVVLLIGLPASLGLYMLAEPLLATLFAYGQFGAEDVIQAAASLRMFALGLPAFMLIKILATGFYADKNIKTPVKVGAMCMVVNVLLIFVFIGPLQHAGLALATTCSAMVNAVSLFVLLKRQGLYTLQPGWPGYALMMLLSLGLMLAWLSVAPAPGEQWLSWALSTRLIQLCLIICVSVLIYLTIMYKLVRKLARSV